MCPGVGFEPTHSQSIRLSLDALTTQPTRTHIAHKFKTPIYNFIKDDMSKT